MVGSPISHPPNSASRAALVAAAERWLRTPYQHSARLHGVAVDCVNLLCAVYEEAGLTDYVEPGFYRSDWMLHRAEERFLMGILEARLHEVARPLPGDIALFRYGRCFSHGAIVVEWPRVIHAFAGLGVVHGDAAKHPLLDNTGRLRAVRFYTKLS
jgi:cell wall-associated NlpC family hydrolase